MLMYNAANFQRGLFRNDSVFAVFVLGLRRGGVAHFDSSLRNHVVLQIILCLSIQSTSVHAGDFSVHLFGLFEQNDRVILCAKHSLDFKDSWQFDIVIHWKCPTVKGVKCIETVLLLFIYMPLSH